MLHFVTFYMKQNKSRKQTLESAQYGLEIIFNISACKRNLLYMQNTGLKVWKPETPVLHINSAAYTRITFLN